MAMKLIKNVTAVTMDDRRRILLDAGIAFDRERIVEVGRCEELEKRYPDAEILDGRDKVAIPGLIDTHAHADQSILRGLGDGMHWIPFLADVIDPWLAERDPMDGVLANTLSMIEMIRSGTTCFVSPNVDPRDNYEALTEAVGKLGIRAVLARFIVPREGPDSPEAARSAVREATECMKPWHESQGGLVKMWFGLMVPRVEGDTCHPKFYREVLAESQELGVGITYHFCSEFEDAVYIENEYGLRPAEWSRENHALGPNVLLINGCWVTPLEIEILADTGTHLAHSPVANMKMATGVLPLPDLLAAGVNVSLGTDGGLNNNTHSMFGEMKSALLLQNAVRRRAKAISPETVLEMATIAGAKAVGRERELGSLEPGKLADIVLVDLNRPHTTPVHDVVSNLVFAANNSNVDTVLIGGRVVLRNGEIEGVDEGAILDSARSRAEQVRSDLGLSTARSWPVR